MKSEWISGYLRTRIERKQDDTVVATVPIDNRIRTQDGSAHQVALLLAIDMAAGLSVGFPAEPRWTLTADMSVDFFPGPVEDKLEAVGVAAHVGGRTALAEITVTDGSGRAVAFASANHALVPRVDGLLYVDTAPGGVIEPPSPAWVHRLAGDVYRTHPVTDGPHASAAIELNDATRNPWGILHGAVLSHLALDAAERAGIDRAESLTIRFLRPMRVGPAHAVVTSTTETATSSFCVVRIFDSHDGTTTCFAHVRGR